jgi:hypothetical protein
MSSGGVPPFGNMYAPPWMGFSPTLKGIRDIENDFDLPAVSVPPAGFALNNKLAIDADADFLVREIQFVISATTGTPLVSDIRVKIRDGDGRMITSDFVPIVDLCGPMVPPLPLRRGSVLTIDYQNVGAATPSVWMILKAWKRTECPSDTLEIAVPYTPMYKRMSQPAAGADLEDFEYPFVFTAAAAGDLLKVPLQTDNDADFLWRGITGDWNTANNDVAVVGSVGLTFYDTGGLPLLQAPLLCPWGSLNCGLFRESAIASGGGRPAPHFPEIFIPRGGVVSVDLSFGAAGTVRFSLRGAKVYDGSCQ